MKVSVDLKESPLRKSVQVRHFSSDIDAVQPSVQSQITERLEEA
jgi:hypothetical protein